MTGRVIDAAARRAGFLTRAQAGLIPPVSISRNIDPALGGVAYHHGGMNVPIASHAGCLSTWRGWQRFHMGANYDPPSDGHGWVDLAYTLGVCQHGWQFAGRGAGIRTAANGTNVGNHRYYAIVWLGGRRQTPTQQALDAIAHGTDMLRRTGAGDRVVGHTDLKATACPHPTLLTLARHFDRRPIPAGTPQEDDVRASLAAELEKLTDAEAALAVRELKALAGIKKADGGPAQGTTLAWITRYIRRLRELDGSPS